MNVIRIYDYLYLLVIGTGFGLSLGFFVRKTMPSLRWPHVAGVTASWGFSLPLALGLQVGIVARVLHSGAFWTVWILGPFMAGGISALIMRNAQKELTLKQGLVIVGGYASGGIVSSLILLWPTSHYYLAGLFARLALGFIGSGVMFWQLSKVKGKGVPSTG